MLQKVHAFLSPSQMIQFFGALFQMVNLHFTEDCNFPSWMIKTNIGYQGPNSIENNCLNFWLEKSLKFWLEIPHTKKLFKNG